MALYELVLRRRVSVRFQEYATAVFAVLLVSFMAYVTFHDYRRAPLFWQLFRSRTVVEQPAEPGPGRAP
jgi:succinate dehydrogenase hydrophobic anchor subunit